ncbi:FAD-binding oxidoreductase [Thermopolyspora sp. NPDC052614]|uniref:FAD-binding oxidoreductase n=1 Tax=Thermopolyspora sp. NPDC052614 TaxID=3155682 RepID=UPI00342EA54C
MDEMSGNELRGRVSGRVLLPGEDGFDAAVLPWNRAVGQSAVAAVVEAANADDVAAVVRHARGAGLSVSAQPSGHGASGNIEGVILVRTAALDRLEVLPERRLARAGAGVTWGRVQAAAGPYGLTGLAGTSPVVSVTGYTLGGGLSWFSRRYGWGADGVRAFEVVDADGERRRIDAESDPELFWALRGGGGDFAIVTEVEFELYPAADLYGGRVIWPEARAAEVLDAFREITAEAPPELSLWFSRLNIPQTPPMVAVDLAHLGTADEARELLARLDKIGGVISDTRGTLSPADLGDITKDPADPAPVKSRTELLARLDDEVAGILLAGPIDPLINVQVRHLGGALAEDRPDRGAAGAVAEPYLLYTLGPALNPELAAAIDDRQRRLVAELGGVVTGRKPYTFLGGGETAEAAFPATALDRLRAIKHARDPRGVIRANFPV